MTNRPISGQAAPADEVIRYVAGSVFSTEWTNNSVTPDPIDGKRHHYNYRPGTGIEWKTEVKDKVLDLDPLGLQSQGRGTANWIGSDGTILSWTWSNRVWYMAPPPYAVGAGHKVLFQGLSLTPLFDDIPDYLLGACKINGVYVVATASGIYYRSTDPNQWNLVADTETLFDVIKSEYIPSSTVYGWGPVRFSASGRQAVAISLSEFPRKRARVDFTLTESDGIISLGTSTTSTDDLESLEAVRDSRVLITDDGDLTEWSATYSAGADLPYTIAADWDGEDLVELQIDLRNVSGSAYKYCPKTSSLWNKSVDDELTLDRYYLVKKSAATVYEYYAGTFGIEYHLSPDEDHSYPYHYPIAIDRYKHSCFHLGFADLRTYSLLGLRMTKDASADSGYAIQQSSGSGYTVELPDESTVWQAPLLVVKNLSGEYALAIGSGSESFFIEDTPNTDFYYLDLQSSFKLLATGEYIAGSMFYQLYNPGIDARYGDLHYLHFPCGSILGLCISNNAGDILFAIDSSKGYVGEENAKKYAVRVEGLFRASTANFTKLSELYDPNDLAFRWDWLTYEEYNDIFNTKPLISRPFIHRRLDLVQA